MPLHSQKTTYYKNSVVKRFMTNMKIIEYHGGIGRCFVSQNILCHYF